MQMKLQRRHAVDESISRHPEFIRKLCLDIHAFTATANRAVVSLYAISQICWSSFGSKEIQHDLASKLMAVVGALSSLCGIIDATAGRCLLSASVVEILTQGVSKCEPIVHTIEVAVHKLDGYLGAQPEKDTRMQPTGFYNAFNPGEEKEPASILSDCFLAIMHAVVTAKAEILSRSDHLTSSESSEAFRLKQALPNSDLKAPTKRSIHFTCSNSARQGTNTLPPHSSPLFDTQPTDPQQPSQHQPVQLNISPTYPSRNLWNFKPWLDSTESPPKLLPSIPTLSKMAFGEANPVNSNSDSTMFEAFGNRNQQHLEAYILRTTIEPSKEFSATWSYKIELLHLDDDAMQAHTKNLGPTYSIITAVGELSLEELRQVQEYTKARDGHLVSVHFGAAVDLVMSMGTFKVKPVVFIIKSSAAPVTDADSKAVAMEANIQKPCFPAFGTSAHVSAHAFSSLFGTKTKSGALFGNNTNPSVPHYSNTNHSWISSSEPWFHQEKLEDNRFGTSHFMSITWAYGSTKSFEEIRLDDIKAGRIPEQAPLPIEEFLNEAPVPKPFLAATKPDVTTIKPAAQSGTFQFGATTVKPQPATTASPIVPNTNTNTLGLFGAPRQDKGEPAASQKFGQAPPQSQLGGLFEQAPRSVSDTSDLDSTYASPAKVAGSAALTRHSSIFKPATLILPKKAGSEFNIVANSYQGKAEERKIPFPVCRKCTKHSTAISANEQCVGLCPACAIEETTPAETAFWLCDTKVPSGIADFSAAVVPNSTTEKEKAPAKPSTPTTSIKPETAAERKLQAKVEDFNPDEESEEMWSTRYDLLQTCQIE